MARPTNTRDIKTPTLPAETVARVNGEINQAATLQGAIQAEIASAALIDQRITTRRIVAAYSLFGKAIDLANLEDIKASKAYKGYVHTFEDGTTRTITTWAEYCQHIEGRSDKTIDEYLASYGTFGPELYEAMRNMGLGPSKMRSLRKLPDDQQAQVAALVALDDKADVKEFADTLISQYAKKEAQFKAQIEEQSAEDEAKERVSSDQRQTIQDLQTQLQRAAQLPPDEIDRELREEAGKRAWAAETGLRGQLRPALQALNDNGNTNGIDVSACIAGFVSQIELALADIRLELNIMPNDALDDGMDWDVPPPASPETH